MAHLLIFLVPLVALVAAVLWLVERRLPRVREAVAAAMGSRVWVGVSAVLLVVFGAALSMTAWLPVAIDMSEVTIACVASLWLHGAPLYTGLGDAARYSLLYGPLCFLLYAGALAGFGVGIGALKAAVVLVNAALFAVLWRVFRRHGSAAVTVVVLGLLAAGLMMKQLSQFMIRGDAPLTLAVGLGLLAVNLRSRVGAVALFALACALGVDLKFTAVFYFMVPLYLLGRRHGRGAAGVAALLGAGVALLPFGLPGVSLKNYMAWVGEAAHHPLALKLLVMNGVMVAVMLAPGVVLVVGRGRPAVRAVWRRHWKMALLLGVSLAGSALTGSKVGAGRAHMNPSMVVCAYVAVLLWERMPESAKGARWVRFGGLIYALLLVVPALSELRDVTQICLPRMGFARDVNADLDEVMRRYPGRTVEMGYNQPEGAEPADPLARFQPRLVFAGNPLLVDAAALFDMGLSGKAVPQATVDAVRECRVRAWVVPKGREPFGLRNVYMEDVPQRFADPALFSPAFRSAFFAVYRRTGESRYFDVWTCED